MAELDADLIRESARVVDPGEDLRGSRVVEIDNLDATEVEERIAAAHNFHSKEAEEEAKKVSTKAYTPVKVAQDTTKEKGPKKVAPTSAQFEYIVSSTGQRPTESMIRKPDSNMADPSEGTAAAEIPLKEGRGRVKAYIVGCMVDSHDNIMELLEIASTEKEIFGISLDSLSIDLPGKIDEYIYKNFQQTSLRFISSWRKRPFNEIHILPPPRSQLPGECALHATLALMESHFKVMYASRPDGPREFTVRLSHLHLGIMVRELYDSEEGKKLKGRDKLATCLLVATIHGVVSEEDFAAGCPPEAVRYRIKEYHELSEIEMQTIPSVLEEGEMILTSFRVTEEYRRTLPHDIYRYHPPTKAIKVHDVHCVVLTSAGMEFKDAEMATGLEWERYYEYLNSYGSWGVDGCGYIYADSLRRSYRIRVVDPEI